MKTKPFQEEQQQKLKMIAHGKVATECPLDIYIAVHPFSVYVEIKLILSKTHN